MLNSARSGQWPVSFDQEQVIIIAPTRIGYRLVALFELANHNADLSETFHILIGRFKQCEQTILNPVSYYPNSGIFRTAYGSSKLYELR